MKIAIIDHDSPGLYVLEAILLATARVREIHVADVPLINQEQHAPRELVEIHEVMNIIIRAQARQIEQTSTIDILPEMPDRSVHHAAHLRARGRLMSMSSTANPARHVNVTKFGGRHVR